MSNLAPARPFFGRQIVAAAFVLATFGWGVGFYGPPIYLHAVTARTGWPVTLVSAAVTLHFLVGAAVVANLPRLYRRWGLPATTTLGAVLLAAGVFGWAIAAEPWQLFTAAILSGSGWVAMGAAAINAVIAPWFIRTRPKALAMAYNGASIGGVLFSPLWVALIAAIGFAHGAIAVGVVMVLVTAALSVAVFARTPEQLGQRPDGDAADAASGSLSAAWARPLAGSALWQNWQFRTLAAGMALGLFAQIGIIAHLYSLLVSALGQQGAGLAMGLATAAAIAGRTLVGWVMPVGADRRLVASACYVVQVIGILALLAAAGTSVPLLLAGVVLFGSGIGNATSLPPLIAQIEFVKEDTQRVVPQIVAMAQATYAFAPAAFGLLRAWEIGVVASGTWVLMATVGVQLAAIGCFLAGRR